MSTDPQVSLQQGTLKGSLMTSRGGKNILSFQGIPYAKPPLGDLRFKAPQEAPSWSGVWDAQSERPRCLQFDTLINEFIGSEDCLYLNVYTPQLTSEGAGLSVMFWIHGGGFHHGAGDSDVYGPHFLLDHNVVLVTINYRLGPFGFLSLGTPETPGNYGLKDQVAALRWVQKNIAKFGGNPDCVTIFGESAGGASVHYLMLSPSARGLFHRAIPQSGSAHNPWAMQRNAREKGFEAAAMLGCKQNDPRLLLESLRRIDALELSKLELHLRITKKRLTHFVPTIEPDGTPDAFLTEEPHLMLARGDIADVPLMAGLMTHEGLLHYGTLVMKKGTIEEDLKIKYSFFVPSELENTPSTQALATEIHNFYQNFVPNDAIERYILLNSDSDFVVGLDDLVRGVAALQRQPVYYYQFSYDGGLGIFKTLSGVEFAGTCHADELGYLFSRTVIPGELEHAAPSDLKVIDLMTKLWTDFAKTGNPTPDINTGLNWEAVETKRGDPASAVTHYLDISEHLQMKHENLNLTRVNFWRQLKLKYANTKNSKL